MDDTEPNPHTLAQKLAVLEERMKTMQAEYKTDIAHLAAEIHKRDKQMIITIVATMIGIASVAVAVLAIVSTS